jgi:hypothetical protein
MLAKNCGSCTSSVRSAAKHDDDPSLPGHKGYQQLAVILEKQGRFQEAIDLCTQAAQQGWGGDWEHRIERNAKRLAKLTSQAS